MGRAARRHGVSASGRRAATVGCETRPGSCRRRHVSLRQTDRHSRPLPSDGDTATRPLLTSASSHIQTGTAGRACGVSVTVTVCRGVAANGRPGTARHGGVQGRSDSPRTRTDRGTSGVRRTGGQDTLERWPELGTDTPGRSRDNGPPDGTHSDVRVMKTDRLMYNYIRGYQLRAMSQIAQNLRLESVSNHQSVLNGFHSEVSQCVLSFPRIPN